MPPIHPVLRWLAPLSALAAAHLGQVPSRPQYYCVRGVTLDREATRRGTLVVRDGAISAVLDESAPTPPGSRVIDGAGLLCLPAFLDAFSRSGCAVPQPVKDQDVPPNELADVGIDMRAANRKGIQPGFRAVEALSVTKDLRDPWRKAGFGAVLVAPGGELLAGRSALVTTREAAARDLIIRDEVFSHASFTANGPGYPSTLMGYFAQLRQFFLDSQRQVELERRYARGRPGPRPPYDAELDAGARLIARDERLLCEANSAADIERWFRLADEFELAVDICGGNEAWRIHEEFQRRSATVVLTLDWGKEVKDPKPESSSSTDVTPPASREGTDEVAPAAALGQEAKVAERGFEYEEPLGVRVERRRKWEELRDCALRLEEAGIPYVFGSANGKPEELLGHIRSLVSAGLPADGALRALTVSAAHFLGVEARLGVIEPGRDATFTLWRSDPLLEKEARPAWLFVDGYPIEFKESERKGGGPTEGVDATGVWALAFEVKAEGLSSATLSLSMDKDGAVTGELELESPMGGGKVRSKVDGDVSGDELSVGCTLIFGELKVETTLTAKLSKDELTGRGRFLGPWSSEPSEQSFKGARKPK